MLMSVVLVGCCLAAGMGAAGVVVRRSCTIMVSAGVGRQMSAGAALVCLIVWSWPAAAEARAATSPLSLVQATQALAEAVQWVVALQ
jgi:hypothetical protein